MPRAVSSPPAGTPSEPTVSVSEALGIPADWDLASALKGTSGTEPPDKADEEPLPGEGEGLEGEKENPEGGEAGDGEEPEKPEGGDGKLAKPAAPKPGEKPAAKPGEKPAGKVAATPVGKGAAKPAAVVKPGKPGEAPVVPKPGEKPADTPPAETKVKVGGKEYTQKELEEMIAKVSAPAKPAPETKPEPAKKTPAEIEAERIETVKKDDEWVATTAPLLRAQPITEEVLDTILGGGKKGLDALQALRQNDMATALLASRKVLYSEFAPLLSQIDGRLQPLIAAHVQAQDDREWNSFVETNPDLSEDRDLIEQAAQVLIKEQPDRVRDMTMEQFKEETAKQARLFKSRYAKPAAAGEKFLVDGTEYTTDEIRALVAARNGGEPAAGVKPAAPATPAKSAAPKRATVKPPGANPPVSTSTPGKKGEGTDAGIIASLF